MQEPLLSVAAGRRDGRHSTVSTTLGALLRDKIWHCLRCRLRCHLLLMFTDHSEQSLCGYSPCPVLSSCHSSTWLPSTSRISCSSRWASEMCWHVDPRSFAHVQEPTPVSSPLNITMAWLPSCRPATDIQFKYESPSPRWRTNNLTIFSKQHSHGSNIFC